MGFVSGSKSIPLLIFCLEEYRYERSLGKTFGNSLTTGTDSMGGILESKSWTLTIWYKYPVEIILQTFKQEMIGTLRIKIPPPSIMTCKYTLEVRATLRSKQGVLDLLKVLHKTLRYHSLHKT